MNLTPKQLHILTRIRDFRLSRGYSPTLQELADEMGVSKVTMFGHVEALVKKGALLHQSNRARSLVVNPEAQLPDEERKSRIPLVGAIAAGSPIEAVEDRQALDLEALFSPPVGRGSRPQETFALKVRGDSMIEDQIRDGDYVIIQKQSTARNGDTVVALLPSGEATLKRYYREGGKIRLQPANANYQPIIVTECVIQGILIGVIRTM